MYTKLSNTVIYFAFFFFFFIVLSLYSCLGFYVTNHITYYTPVYLSYEDLRNSFKVEESRPLVLPGKLCVYQNYLFVNDRDKGIHIYNNSDPRNPEQIAFLSIPGNYDMTVKEGILYADSFTDIITINISNIQVPSSIYITKRLEGVISYNPIRNIGEPLIEDNHAGLFYHINEVDHTKGVVIGWEKEVISSEQWIPGSRKKVCFSPPGGEPVQAGIVGSLSRFMVHDDFLYAVDVSNLNIFDIRQPGNPVFKNTLTIDPALPIYPMDNFKKTIYSYHNLLAIGYYMSTYLFSTENDPAHPELISKITHFDNGDAVIIQDNYAFVTFHYSYTLIIIDISDLNTPFVAKTYSLKNPSGLGIDNTLLFVCQDQSILLYDITDPLNPVLITQVKPDNYPVFDIITNNERLYVTGARGIYQYDYSDLENIEFLSLITAPVQEDMY